MSLAHPIRAAKMGPNDRPKRPGPSDFDAVDDDMRDRALGEILRDVKPLTEAQVEQVLQYQQLHGMRFGEAAVALGFSTRDEVLWALAKQFHYPYAAAQPAARHQELVVAGNPFGEQAEAFRELRSQLMMDVLAPDAPRRALAVVSPDVGDGKTFIAANLAVAFSQLGVHTLLIDMDMRTPRQHQLFQMENRSGVSNILSGRSESNVIRPVADLPSLFVLPAGPVPPNPLELVQSSAFGMLVHELLTKFDFIIVDTPATVHGADARVVAAKSGAALAVCRRGNSRMQAMNKLIGSLAKGPTTLAGVVMNDR